jgi:hypothetical protein
MHVKKRRLISNVESVISQCSSWDSKRIIYRKFTDIDEHRGFCSTCRLNFPLGALLRGMLDSQDIDPLFCRDAINDKVVCMRDHFPCASLASDAAEFDVRRKLFHFVFDHVQRCIRICQTVFCVCRPIFIRSLIACFFH